MQVTGILGHIITVYITAALSQSCPEKNTRIADSKQCDKYVECQDGVPEEKLCPEGLVFDEKARYFTYPCKYPVDVDCGSRTALQPDQPSGDCPHQFGFFRAGSNNDCGLFMNCVNGHGYMFNCPEGLAFNEDTLQCDWPDQVASCDSEAYLGFKCPETKSVDNFPSSQFSFFRHKSDCHKYFICLDGKPRLFSCGETKGFSDETEGCEDLETVPGCT